jgi:predicted ATPase
MQRAAGFLYDDSAQVKLDKLDALLARTSTAKQDAALFAELLSLPNDGRHPALELPAQQLRQKTFAALDAQVETLARQNPILMIFEDAHWADPTSLEAFGRVVDWITHSRGFLIVTHRPEFAPPWTGQPQVTTLTLNRLSKRDMGAIIERIIGNRGVPDDVRQDIIERTDDIPLFVEEMTKAVL